MVFTIKFDSVDLISEGEYQLNNVCDMHHVHPGEKMIIDGATYKVKDYNLADNTIRLLGDAEITATSTNLSLPNFFHGTPMAEENDLVKTPMVDKTPMIYLMEPYEITIDDSSLSAIDRRCNVKICFLTESDPTNWRTDDFYHNAITPMKNLMEDMVEKIISSGLFYTDKLKIKTVNYTNFGIRIPDYGTKKLYFSEKLSGVMAEMTLEIYKEESCDC